MASFGLLGLLLVALAVTPQGLANYEKPPEYKPPVYTPPVETPPVYKPPIEKPPVYTPPIEKPPVYIHFKTPHNLSQNQFLSKCHHSLLLFILIFSFSSSPHPIQPPNHLQMTLAVELQSTTSTTSSILKKTAVSRSWILLDRDGRDTLLDVDKYAIMRLVDINARDLRIMDPLLSYPSTILGREKVIVLNLEHIKAIITAEEVLLRDPMDDDVVAVVEELRRRLPKVTAATLGEEESCTQDGDGGEGNEFPFEFRALEVVLEAICSFLDARTKELEIAAYPALDELTSKISSRNLDKVRKLKSAMTRLTNRVQKIREELENLLDDDEDMADLYLSRKLAVSSSTTCSSNDSNWLHSSPNQGSKIHSRGSVATIQGENDVEELEMLLEAYFMQIDGTLNKLTTLREYIDDTEDYINIQLDNHRNQLIQLELFLSSGTVCLSIYSLVAAIFGMNIPYTWREGHGHMFKWVVILTGMACASLFTSIVSYARRKGLVGS